ncbi:Very-long-chain (3R)-3-hydroxyacyl-CoA dehydratase [Rhizoctonia solani]|uniref:Very-long-chain (3R)-3-hydroxyacyl-CoA dehydratase n=1 Tax=Rhizoctonia solani TaxID=456999 RepID=A0A8H7I5B9_9AGAM|nr:Very-long-chain (3R)-3-hydroxyacyl-CoA dehydratase [Rhizoctonia solani]
MTFMASHPPAAGQPRTKRVRSLVCGPRRHRVHLSGHSPIHHPSTLARLFNAAKTPKTPYWLPSSLEPIFKRACTTGRSRVAGIRRSPLITTAMQVASRVYLVWGVTESFSATRSNPFYATMVLAWSITEVIRYSFYACNLAGSEPHFLLYYILCTVPPRCLVRERPHLLDSPQSSPLSGKWTPYDYLRGFFVLIWTPGLYVMYTYMIKQRRKVLGGGKARPGSQSRLEHLQSQSRKNT